MVNPEKTRGTSNQLNPSTTTAFRKTLLVWFAAHQRVLPWRTRRTPYRVWLSEIMLQQTRVEQATPYFQRFVRQFPSVNALAAARRNDVLKLWEGLGYYSRAIRAHETARNISNNLGGKFPGTYDELLKLPGVGPYTAAAISSLAFGLDHAVLDGNVIRVLTRVFAVEEVPNSPQVKRRLEELLDHLLPIGQAAEFNEAMMELGALVCTPAKPACDQCPLRKVCRALKQGDPTRFPVRKLRKSIPHRNVGAGVIIDDKHRVLIARRNEKAMLGGMWEFPGGGVEKGESVPDCIHRELHEELGIQTRVGPHLITVKHTFSHFRMSLHAHWVRIDSGLPKAIGCAGWKWVPAENISAYPLPRADQKILAALLNSAAWPVF